jgi:tRNA G18 (ribose-2'-O)-methylase SpoU
VRIPISRAVDSLNVAVAVGIALHACGDSYRA